MLSLFRTLSLRYLWLHWLRAGLVVLSIALGVATWVATDALSRALDQSLRQAAAPLRGTSDLYVTNSAVGFVDAGLMPRLLAVPGVERVEPVLIEQVAVVPETKDPPPAPDKVAKPEAAVLLGLRRPENKGDDKDLTARGIQIVDINALDALKAETRGRLPVIVGQQLDEDLLKKNPEFLIRVGDREHKAMRVGQVRASGAAATLGGHVLLADWERVARLLGRPGKVHRLDVTFTADADREETARRIKDVVKDTAEVQTAADQDRRMRELTRGMEVGFKLCGAGALVVGLFLVYNAMSVNVRERRHDIGILRSLGATRPQIRLLFFAEALLMGLVGSALGIPLGLGMAYVSLGPVQKVLHGIFLPLQGREVETTPAMLLTAAVAGVATSLLAALVPASHAAAEEPADAVRRAPLAHSIAHHLLQIGGSATLILLGSLLIALKEYLTPVVIIRGALGLLALGVPLVGVGYRRLIANNGAEESPGAIAGNHWPALIGGLLLVLVGGLGILWREALAGDAGVYMLLGFVFLGALLAGPLLTAVIARLVLQPLARQFLPVASRLAADNLVRSPGRTGLVIVALAAGVALMVQTAGLIRSNEDAFMDWVRVSLQADLYVSAGGPISASGQTKAMPEKAGREILAEMPPGSRLVGMTERHIDWNPENRLPAHGKGGATEFTGGGRSTVVYLVLQDARAYWEANKDRPDPDPGLELWKDLGDAPGRALVSENFARIHGVKVGDAIQLTGQKGMVRWRVIGTLRDYNWIRGTIFLDRQSNRAAFGADQVTAWQVYLPANSTAEEAKTVREKLQKSAAGSKYALLTLTRAEVHENVASMVRRVYGVAYTQEVVVGIVAVFGVVTSLLISVLGRRRELGLIRAVGGTRPQLLQTVMAEAVLIGLVGTVLGVVVGLPMEWYMVRVVLFEETGFLFPVRIPWTEAGVIAALAVLSAAVAGIGPALQAMRLRIADAVAYE